MALAGPKQTYVIYRPDVWEPKIDIVFKAKLVAAKYFQDYSDGITEGGKTLIIPSDAEYTTQSVATTSGDVESVTITDTGTRLDINVWEATVRTFPDFQQAQVASSYRLKETYANTMAHALAKHLDTALLALGANFSEEVDCSAGAGIRSSNLEAAIAVLESHNIPREDCVFFFHPLAYYKEVLNIQKLYDASQFGKASLIQGTHDTLYGIPVVVTSQVPTATFGHRNLLASVRAFCYAIGNLPNGQVSGVRLQEKQAEALRVTVIGDIMYGVKNLGPGTKRGVKILSRY